MIRQLGSIAVLAFGVLQSASGQVSPVTRAARTITAADVRRRVFVIADDSMGGRNTPSPGLRSTAAYIAGEFQRFGLRPGGDSGGYLLSYPIEQRRVMADRSELRFAGASQRTATLSFAGEAALAYTSAAPEPVTGSVVLLSGVFNRDSVAASQVKGRVALLIPSWKPGGFPNGLVPVLQALLEDSTRAIVVLVDDDSSYAQFAAIQARGYELAGVERERLGREPMVIFVREAALTRQIPEAAAHFAQLRAAAVPVVQAMDDWSVEAVVRDTALTSAAAPDVVGILEGSDSTLKHEYVVFSAHMDHVGTSGQPGAQCFAQGGDKICNGADDDASGTAGVLELAEAFSQPGARPKRSLIFLTVSGEEHGLWGSDWFVQHPPVPLPQLVADLNLDMIGRNWKDTIVAIGKEHSDLGATLNRVNAAHRELHMVAVDDRWPEESFYTRSDHYNFARKGVPILFFFNGVHADYHQPSDSPDKLDAEKESRILRLLYYLGREVGNAAQRPKWAERSYREIVRP